MVQKNNGKKKKNKFIKCDNCKNRVEIIDEEIIKISNLKYVECPFCGMEIILK